MADILATFGILLALGIIFPGMLTAWWLLFPVTVERAQLRLERTPWQCFGLGGAIALVLLVPIGILLALPLGVTQFMGSSLLFITLAFASLGAAGLAAKMGEQLAARSGNGLSPAGVFVRGAVALELAAAFPIIGWFIVIPLVTITSLGALAFALMRWTFRAEPLPDQETTTEQASSLPLAGS